MGGEVATFTCGTCGSLTTRSAWRGNARKGRVKNISTRWRSPVVPVADSVPPLLRSSADRGLVDVTEGTGIRCYADSSRGRFHCLATAHQAIAAHAPVVLRPGCEAPSDHQSEHRSAGRRASVRWSRGHGACRAENPFAALQVIPRSPHLQPAWRLPGRFTVNARRCGSSPRFDVTEGTPDPVEGLSCAPPRSISAARTP